MSISLNQSRTPANWFGIISSGESTKSLKDLRIEKGYTTSISFARAAGIHPATYSSLENHHYEPSNKFKQKIATTLGMDIEEVFPAPKESKVKINVIHESPIEIEIMLQREYGDKLLPKKALRDE